MKFTKGSEQAPYNRSNHGSFHDEFNVETPTETKKKSWKRCCCWTIVVVFVLLLLLFLLGLTLYLVTKPKYPSVEMTDITIASVKVTPKREGLVLKALLSLNMTAHLTAINPNRFRITYSPTEADVSYKDLFVGNSSAPALDQPGRSNHTMPVLLVSNQIDVMQGTGLSLLKDFAKDVIPFTIVGVVRARVHFLGVTSSVLKVKLICDIIVHPTQQILVDKKCRVA